MASYKGKFPDSYWDRWTRNTLSSKLESWIDAGKLREIVEEVGIDKSWINIT